MKVRIDYEIGDDLIRGEIGNAFDHGIQYWCARVVANEFPDGAEYLSDIPTMGGEVLLTDHCYTSDALIQCALFGKVIYC